MKVMMIENGYQGCGYVRLSLPAYHNGFELVGDKTLAREKLQFADVVVFHRPEEPEHLKLAKILKGMGKKIVMDNDDTFRLEDDIHPLCRFTPEAAEVTLGKRIKAIEDFLKIADLVTTTTETLANEYREINDNVVILPNCVDEFDWEEPKRNEGDKVRIGLVGSVSMEYDYRHIKDVLRKLDKRKDVQLCIFGLGDKEHRKNNPNVTKVFKDDYKFWDSLNIEQIPWAPIDMYPELLNSLRLDIMLIPRKDNYFNKCKSNIKFLEAAMCEIPVIAQSYEDGPYEELRNTKDVGYLITDNYNWEAVINLMIADKHGRREMGKNAKEYVLNNYNIEVRGHEWLDAYRKLYE